MKKRPAWVWVIVIFYLSSFVFTAFSFYAVFGGMVPLTGAQQSYFASLGTLDWLEAGLIMLINLAALVSLFMLRRIAVALFSISLVLNILQTIFQAIAKGWTNAVGGPGLVGVLIAWIILLVVILYCRHLAKNGVLT